MQTKNKEIRKLRADARSSERANRSPQEQLRRLDSKLGHGVGAKKERIRLSKLINNSQTKRSNTNG